MAKWPNPSDPEKTDIALSAELTKKLADVVADLRVEIDDLRSEFDEQTERWQGGDKGDTVGAWLDELDELHDSMDNAETSV